MIALGTAVHRVVSGRWAQNGYVVAADGGDAVVVDPGGRAHEIAEHVAANGLRVHAVLATHGHPDHVAAAAQVVADHDVPFAVHSAEADVLRRVNFFRFVLEQRGSVAVPPIAIDLAQRSVLRFGSLEIAVVHTLGHSPGSVCLEIAGMLFTGDTLAVTHTGTTELPGFDAEALATSVRGLARAYPPETVVHPGHGAPGTLREALTEARA